MSKEPLYPLRFRPILKSPLWGGTKLASLLNKHLEGLAICGESWEISGVKDNVSVVTDGPLQGHSLVDLIKDYKSDLVGSGCYEKFGEDFPLLIKFIDANQDLSIQVHPNDQLAKVRHNSFGKTEMWYVIDAEPGSTLISGFRKQTNKQEYLEYFKEGKLLELLNKEDVETDDVFFLPAGRVHTIGKGLVIAEIQQTSDVTYRIYDFDRVDKDGNKRQLHVDEAVEAIDYNYYENYKTSYDRSAIETELVTSEYFTTNRLLINDRITRDYLKLDSFIILMILNGEGKISSSGSEYAYNAGDTFLIPANCPEIEIRPVKESKILEVYLPS